MPYVSTMRFALANALNLPQRQPSVSSSPAFGSRLQHSDHRLLL